MTLDRPKTTGPRSENNHFMGHVRDIASQLEIPTSMLHHVAYAILMIDAEGLDEWPAEDGQPMRWRNATSAWAALAIERAHHFADYYGMYLVERDKYGREYRVSY